MDSNIVIRKARNEDYKHIFSMVKEMADFEKLSDRVTLTEQEFISDATCSNPKFHCFVATLKDSTQIIGYALYYFIYSTFQGQSMYLEEMYVKEQHRGKGVGTKLYKAIGKEAVQAGCCRLDFIVLDWNEKGIEFHKKMGAQDITQTERWHLFRIEKQDLTKMAE